MPDSRDPQLDDLRRRARRRLVGAIVLALAAAVLVPMLLESDPKPLGEDVAVRIPPVDDGKFVSKLGDKGKESAVAPKPEPLKPEPPKLGAAKPEAAKPEPPKVDAPPAAESWKASKDAATPAAPAPDAKASADKPAATPEAAPAAPPSLPPVNATPTPAKPAEAPKTAAAPPKDAASGKTPEPAKSAEPAKAGAPAVAEPARSTPADAKAGSYSVQLAAFIDDKGANALAGRLKKSGYPAYTEPYNTSRGTLWRVRVGPFPSRDAAEAARAKLKGDGQNGIITAAAK